MKEQEFDQQIALIKWRSLIIDAQPEIAPIFEINGSIITLYAGDMSVAYQASKHFPKGCGYGYRIFCGGQVRFVTPPGWEKRN